MTVCTVLVIACSNSKEVVKKSKLGFENEGRTSCLKVEIDTLVVLSKPFFGDSVKLFFPLFHTGDKLMDSILSHTYIDSLNFEPSEGTYQEKIQHWAEDIIVESNFSVNYNKNGFLSISQISEGCGAYCTIWDKHFKISRADVEEFVARYIPAGGSDPTYDQTMIPESIRDWPANGNSAQDQFLAPFYDQNGNGYYEPEQGDYPDYNITGDNDEAELYGDQTLWWIFNDKGNIHTETEADPIGLEIHAQVSSKSKLFSGASTEFGKQANENVSLVDAAMPGMLPVINEHCIKQAIKSGHALGAKINKFSVRKI